jgi:hypothetical protein
VQEYVALRRAVRSLLPGFFVAVAGYVQANANGSPSPRPFVGELDRGRLVDAYPDLGLDASVDWVAFGFPEIPDYMAHVGVLLDTDVWLPRCEVGLHISDGFRAGSGKALTAPDRFPLRGLGYYFAVAVREHRLTAPPFSLSVARSSLDHDVGRAGAEVIELWSAAVCFLGGI